MFDLAHRKMLSLAGAVVAASILSVPTLSVGHAQQRAANHGQARTKISSVHLNLTPSSDQLATCMPHARLDVNVTLATDAVGFDLFSINAQGLPPNTDFTTFLLEQA